MDKEAIAEILEEKHQKLFNWLESQPEEKWETGPEGKWTVGQHVQHLTDSIKLLNHAMSFPPFLLKYKYGTTNRELRDYKTVAQRYQEKLQANQKQAQKFNSKLKIPLLAEKESLLTTLKIQQKNYNTRPKSGSIKI